MENKITQIYQQILSGQKSRFPSNTWSDISNAVFCTRYLIDNVLKWTDDDIKLKLNKTVFVQYKLKGMLTTVYDDSPYRAFDAAFPGRLKEWELKSTPKNFWTEDKAIEAIHWLLEEKLNDNDQLRVDTFEKYGLSGMFQTIFPHNLSEALIAAYPDGLTRTAVIKRFQIHTRVKDKV
ncbi:DUF4046 domain-containing protein [Lysinibacillus piscis]|uniref:DUF4046 domain-containing protein n=1 Tax=Lysinibacillus piscis TaxID=2518931 RepID=A0ABQ5NLT9_9BACI|nr:DUF4046 domain-containing protein [Lysinibacillus sp. KH24]GLC89320.1 hypothetical protein LYSBPC_24470 [Lysinibacillus sp. KH24]